MSKQPTDYEKLYHEEKIRREEEQRRREEAERAQKEAQRVQKEAEHAQKEEQRRREDAESARNEAEHARRDAEEQTRKTSLPEFLHHCHHHLSLGLTVQTDATQSTQGDPSNADRKPRPDYIRAWEDFGEPQEAIWADLMESNFVTRRQFSSIQYMQETGENVSKRLLGSEMDLNYFQRTTVEDPVSAVITMLFDDTALREKLGLKGSVRFENHGNTLSPESAIQDGVQQLSISRGRRRSPRLQEREIAQRSESATIALPDNATKSSRPRADQFCVYSVSDDSQDAPQRIPAFLIEYKAPHKLSPGTIYEGLKEMDIDTIVQVRDDEDMKTKYRRLIAAVITQPFSYMVKAGLEYGVVCTGEAYIFLRVGEDPRTVYYFLSVPNGDVGPDTGWTPGLNQTNRLHLTAVGQMLAFTLLAMRGRPRAQQWRDRALAQLKTWQVEYNELLEELPTPERDTSDYRPRSDIPYFRDTPIQLRRRKPSPNCSPRKERSSSDSESDPDTPSRSTQRPMPRNPKTKTKNPTKRSVGRAAASDAEGQKRSYCTQGCLRGLLDGGPLDRACPNFQDHGTLKHQIDRATFLQLMQEQLANDMDHDVECLRVHGSRGVLFRVRLSSHGYTVAAKGTPACFVQHLRHEADVYERLRPIQGQSVPVHLGNIDLPRPYYYDGIAELVHIMFMSHGGRPIAKYITPKNRALLSQQTECAFTAIHNLAVLHKDPMPRNLLWSAETQQVLVIDFERAQLPPMRPVLGVLSPNRKRKRLCDIKSKSDVNGGHVLLMY
ncbi:hypothetical protein EJ05DRAFT_495259 [Pseudovirgaria hyperparasitica]|uniref:Protein kinase domain-containing protein n=1 Tax=Pseudovirgaria hyperparasitica TaxID=470096 RepID=A0A6A6VRN5_9PEZI|nr:uncharacterized protein EJ05DRAFT_495259 [Pseudovirgaria hyperparasitica]KAF2752446.1 hypothetical protein EJ05DRAFT_495259 [Pseudovirgaria hyperparasitica]